MTHEIPTRKNPGPTKYPLGKIWDPGNTHEKKFETHEIPTVKNFGSTNYPREKFSDQQRQDDTMARDSRYLRWHETQGI